MKKLNLAKCIVIYFFLIGNVVFAQKDKDQFNYNIELAFVNDSGLVELLQNIISEKNSCGSNDWYINFKTKNQIMVSQERIANLLTLNRDNLLKSIFATTLNNRIVYIVTNEENEAYLSKTGLKIDLSKFIGKDVIDFQHFSYWLVGKKNKKYEILHSKVLKCD